ncbi:FtsX-like permease family protein [Streptomyces sp. SID4919]|uniref:ABC transporter permease n=1 Tax=unclassified Streptomyces TaxID=2593676 RepID=UPI000823F14D|nr:MULTISPECIES: ABC transporter permease [unclassified Streptomyces]MYY13306.1 FtsX-like permease family protein [Streptomyces sp. SID4919]SCK61834.1 putative ABC transport system permease protein [Streptomyces sp. AmelKG-E11A]
MTTSSASGASGTSGTSSGSGGTSVLGRPGSRGTSRGRSRHRSPAGDRPRLRPARLSPRDVLKVGAVGLRTRPLRAFLSALGIAIGIAAMVAVVGISSSSRADLDRTLDALGTNLLTVAPGSTMMGGQATLPLTAEDMVSRIGPVDAVSAIGKVPDTKVYRNDKIPAAETGGLSAYAVRDDLRTTVGAELRAGSWLNAATARYPAVVLGSDAAARLGIGKVDPDTRVLVGQRWFTVVGILEEAALAPELDAAALIGWRSAATYLGFDGHATTIYTRSAESAVPQVQSVLGATANPQQPDEVNVSRPSDALAAQQAAGEAFTGLLLGLGAVALLVGGVGVANTMVISVLERRAEIGLRRSLGATRGQIRTQFLAESLLLSALGGLGGAVLGTGVTGGYAVYQGWPTVVPLWAVAGGIAATLVIGGLAGLYPAIRASRLSPTEALSAT